MKAATAVGWLVAVVLAALLGIQSCHRGQVDAKAKAAADSAKVRELESSRTILRVDTVLSGQRAVDSQLAVAKTGLVSWRHEATRLAGVVAALRGTVGRDTLPVLLATDTCAPWAKRLRDLGVILDSTAALDAADSMRAHLAEGAFRVADSARGIAVGALRGARDTLAAARDQLAKWPAPPRVKSWGVLVDARLSGEEGQAFAGVQWKALAAGLQGHVEAGKVALRPEARVTFSTRLF